MLLLLLRYSSPLFSVSVVLVLVMQLDSFRLLLRSLVPVAARRTLPFLLLFLLPGRRLVHAVPALLFHFSTTFDAHQVDLRSHFAQGGRKI